MFLACKFYKILIDPLLKKLRKEIASLIPEKSNIIEIGSGTGAQSIILSQTANRVVGIDINDVMTSCATKKANSLNLNNIKYHTADGSNLNFISDKEFDFAIITLALHELENELRIQIINEMKRISNHLIIADYNAPLPKNFSGFGSNIIEKIAGGSHYKGFKDYIKKGGIITILNQMDLKIENQYNAISNSIIIIEIKTS